MTSTIQLPVTLRPSRTKAAGLFLLSLGFVLGGIWMVTDGEPVGYFCAGFFALGLPVFALQFHPKAAYLHLAPEGFTFCALFRTHTTRWRDVQAFAVTCIRFSTNRTVTWDYTPEFQPTRRARGVAKFLCGYEAALPDTYGMKPHELASLMEKLRQRYAETSNA